MPKDEGKYQTNPTIGNFKRDGLSATLTTIDNYQNIFDINAFQINKQNIKTSIFSISINNVVNQKQYSSIAMSLSIEGESWIANNSQPIDFKISRLDTVNYVIAGTFAFIGTNRNGKLIEIKEGRFDLKYSKL